VEQRYTAKDELKAANHWVHDDRRWMVQARWIDIQYYYDYALFYFGGED
jgi:hypothetical protein